ncbi:MAG TPA: dihydrolipoamide acetyltransferase family protein [Syntrophorhabdales bacterium]|nr:dihydrolipoamide acetyltransferase family protein [Syntrophorhabdales bacterium]
MAVNITIPRLGTVGGDATLLEWVSQEGDQVEKDAIVLVIETQKIKFDVVAETAGLLHIIVAEGVKCPVGTVVGMIAASTDELERLQREAPLVTSVEEAPRVSMTDAGAAPVAQPSAESEGRTGFRISPVARKMAEEHMIDITRIAGTGPEGRIVKEDIEKAIAAKAGAPASPTGPQSVEEKKVRQTIPLKGMRAAIAEHMHRSLVESAQLTAMGEIDMTELIRLRKAFLAREADIGTRITYNDLLVFTVARVLKEKPIVNSSIIGNEIMVWDDINIGVAVALEEGLIVPVVRNADKKPISEISRISKALSEKARAGKLMPDEVSGGTFTLTNLGAAGAGWRFETAIINPPESAILGVGGVTDRAVVRDGQIVARPIMTYSFTYDHRVIDGAVAVQFMARVIELLEDPRLLIF